MFTSPTSPSVCLNAFPQTFSYEDLPQVTSVYPTFVPSVGGTRLTLTGSGFSQRGSIRCRLGDEGESSLSLTSYGYAGGEGLVFCTVPSLGRASIEGYRSMQLFLAMDSDHFYPTSEWVTLVPPLAVSSVDPTTVDEAGNQTISVIGDDFPDLPELACRFGGGESLPALWVRSTLLRCLTPATLAPGEVAVDVTFNGVDFVAAPQTLRVHAELTVTDMSPLCGPMGGGTEVALTVVGLGAESAFSAEEDTEFGCSFGGVMVGAHVTSPSTIFCRAPAGFGIATVDTNGLVPVALVRRPRSSPGTSSLVRPAPRPFLYVEDEGGMVLDPSSGPSTGGTRIELVSIHGVIARMRRIGVEPSLRCRFRSIDSGTVMEASNPTMQADRSDSVLCTSPPLREAVPSAASVEVSVNGGADYLVSRGVFVYFGSPTVVAVEPPSTVAKGGSVVRVLGEDFPTRSGKITCVFEGSASAAAASILSSTTIECAAPPHPPGMVLVSVSFNGADISPSTAMLEYVEELQISSIEPAYAAVDSETSVRLRGTGFVNSSLLCLRWRPRVEQGSRAVTPWHVVRLTFVDAHETTFQASSIAMDYEDSTVSLELEVSNNGLDYTPVQAGVGFAMSGPPRVLDAFPAYVSTGGGALLSIVGGGFLPSATWCRFGIRRVHEAVDVPEETQIAPVKASVKNATHLTCQTPAVAPGSYFVEVLTGEERYGLSRAVGASTPPTASATAELTVIPAPSVRRATPQVLPETGGVMVTVEGSNLTHTGLQACRFGADEVVVPAIWWDESRIECRSPPHSPGVMSLGITLDGVQWASVLSGVRYEPDRLVYSLSPPSGPMRGGTVVRVRGTGFSSAQAEQVPWDVLCSFGELEVSESPGRVSVPRCVSGGSCSATRDIDSRWCGPACVSLEKLDRQDVLAPPQLKMGIGLGAQGIRHSAHAEQQLSFEALVPDSIGMFDRPF